MAVRTYSCVCGHRFDTLTGSQISGGNDAPTCPECHDGRLTEVFGGGQTQMKGFDYSKMTPLEREMAISNRKKLEAKAEKILSGEESPFVVPKGIPQEFVPRLPSHLKKTYC